MKKSFTALLSLFLAGVLLIGTIACDSDSNNDSDNHSGNTDKQTEQKKDGETADKKDADGWEIDDEPTCTDVGSKFRVNEETGEKEWKDIPPTGHRIKDDKCTVCGKEADTGFEFELNEDGTGYILVDSGTERSGDIIIPSAYKGLPVVEIGQNAFSGCDCLSIVAIPESVTKIGYGAFNDCWSLDVINIPTGVTKIEQGVFDSCWELKSIVIPKGVTSIGMDAFSGCDALERIEIPDGVTYIGENAFLGCDGLVEVVIPESVTEIEKYAFKSCLNLKSVSLPSGLTHLGAMAFKGCESIESVVIPKGITQLTSQFDDCRFLVSVEFEVKDGWHDRRGNPLDVTDPAENAKVLKKQSNGAWTREE